MLKQIKLNLIMKELSIEQKAKRYDEAIKRVKKELKACGSTDCDATRQLFRLFPELKESKDKGIKKVLIDYFKKYKEQVEYGIKTFFGIPTDNMIAWIEKQGETFTKKDVYNAYVEGIAFAKDELEKQGTKPKDVTYTYEVKTDNGNISALVTEKVQLPKKLKKQGELKSSKWTEGDVIKHGGILALVINGRKAIKSNCEQITIQYPDEWVKAETKERKYFFDALEKQNKQKLQGKSALDAIKEWEKDNNANKVEPKFRLEKDKWYVCTSQYCNCIEGRNYKASLDGRIIDDYGTEYYIHNNAYRWFRPWTIQDAKDGDVLATSEGAFIYNGNNGGVGCPGSYCGINTLGNFKTGAETHWTSKIVNPATKEKRDLLFKKMHEAGYEWDSGKKELKKIKQGHAAKNIVEIWKDMRFEVYAQADGNRHEPNYSDNSTKMFSLSDIDGIIEKISEQLKN